MNTLPTCPVCGHEVEPDGEHTEVEVSMNPAEEPPQKYWLHRRCASAVFDGWNTP